MPVNEFHKLYRTERLILSVSFALMMLFIGALYTYQNPDLIFLTTAKAVENTTEVFASVVRGIAY